MENLYYNLSEEEFSKSRKILLWIFATLFLTGGLYVLFISLVLGQKSIHPILSVAPFGISFIVFIIAALATFKGSNLFFQIDRDKIEYKYGTFKPIIHSFRWDDIREVEMAQKQKKVKLVFKDGSAFKINLIWIQKTKSSHIRKQLYYVSREKEIPVKKVGYIK